MQSSSIPRFHKALLRAFMFYVSPNVTSLSSSGMSFPLLKKHPLLLPMQVVGIITRHNLTHKRLHEIRQKKTEAMEQKSTPKAASFTDDVFSDDFTSTSSV